MPLPFQREIASFEYLYPGVSKFPSIPLLRSEQRPAVQILRLLESENVPTLLNKICEGFAHILHVDSHFAQLLRDSVGICAG